MTERPEPLTEYFALPSCGRRTAPAAVAPPRRDYAALAARITAAARPPFSWRRYGTQVTPDGAERYHLFLVHVPAAAGGRSRPAGTRERSWRVLLNGGTHGDEPAGAEALVRFVEQRRYARWPQVAFSIVPCANPWGYVHDRRDGPGGVDLNRCFHRASTAAPEVMLLKRALGGQSFDLVVDCHEDVDAPGAYVFGPGALGRVVAAAVAARGPIHPGPLVDGALPLAGGVVEFDAARASERRRAWPTWPLVFYLAERYRAMAQRRGGDGELPWAGVETPTALPLEQRVAMHLAAVDAAVAALAGNSAAHRPEES